MDFNRPGGKTPAYWISARQAGIGLGFSTGFSLLVRCGLRRLKDFREHYMLDKFDRFNNRISVWCEWVGVVALLVMMTVTCVDVVGAKVFKWRLLGALDIVTLAQIVAIGFAAGITLIKGQHIRVEFFFKLLPQPARVVIHRLVLLCSLGLFILIIWRLCVLGESFQSSGEYSSTAYIPLYPFAYSIAFACVPVCLILIHKLVKSLVKGEQQ
jgi:TRAP-type C4-dicarboxylate transport system permease small subunit